MADSKLSKSNQEVTLALTFFRLCYNLTLWGWMCMWLSVIIVQSFLQGLLMKDPRQRLSWPELLYHPFIAGRVTGEYWCSHLIPFVPNLFFSICLSLQTSVLVKPVTHPGPFLQWLMTQQSRALPIPSPASCLLNFKHWKSNRYTLWPLTVVWQRSWRRPGRRWLRKLGERWEAGRVVPDKVPHSIMGLSPL